MSIESDVNDSFIKDWTTFIKNPERVTNDPMEAHYIGFKMWVEAVTKAGTHGSRQPCRRRSSACPCRT